MAKKKSAERTGSFPKINGRPLEPPVGKPGDTCEIQYGFNPHIRKVLMRFQFSVQQVVFSPEEAEHAAHQLLMQAKAARG